MVYLKGNQELECKIKLSSKSFVSVKPWDNFHSIPFYPICWF